MRLLLLLSALLTALTGVVTGTATAATPVQASASAAQAGARTAIAVAPVLRGEEHAFPIAIGWHVAATPATHTNLSSFGQRRRE